MTSPARLPLFRKVDCLRVPAPDLDAGLTLLDMSKGRLVTDADGNVIGPAEP